MSEISVLRCPRILELIESVYLQETVEAAVQAAFAALESLIPHGCGIFLPVDRSSYEHRAGIYQGIETDVMRSYLEYYAPLDPFLRIAPCLQELNRAFRFSDFASTCGVDQTAFVDFMRLVPYHHPLGSLIGTSGLPVAAFGLGRPRGEPDFSETDAAVLERIVPHLARAVSLLDLKEGDMSFRETAVVVFDGGGAVVYQTPAAAALLGVSADCRVQRLFRHASGPIDSEAGPLRVRRVPLRPSSLFGRYRAQTGGLGAAVTGNGRNGAVGCNGARCPQIIVLEPLRHRHDLMTRLRQHGFSQREIEVAAAVLRGRNNPTIAKACAIDPATVKVHLRNIYEKVGVHSRAELTARILGFDSGWGWALQRPVTPKKTGPLPL